MSSERGMGRPPDSAPSSRETGREGERMVAEYLVSSGYRILETNYYAGHREIDIIAMKNDTIAFVEVKTRKSARYGSSLQSVTPRKIRHLAAAARVFLHRGGYRDCTVRFDVAGIDENGIQYIENAFYP